MHLPPTPENPVLQDQSGTSSLRLDGNSLVRIISTSNLFFEKDNNDWKSTYGVTVAAVAALAAGDFVIADVAVGLHGGGGGCGLDLVLVLVWKLLRSIEGISGRGGRREEKMNRWHSILISGFEI